MSYVSGQSNIIIIKGFSNYVGPATLILFFPFKSIDLPQSPHLQIGCTCLFFFFFSRKSNSLAQLLHLLDMSKPSLAYLDWVEILVWDSRPLLGLVSLEGESTRPIDVLLYDKPNLMNMQT